jgi:hypothetical protein
MVIECLGSPPVSTPPLSSAQPRAARPVPAMWADTGGQQVSGRRPRAQRCPSRSSPTSPPSDSAGSPPSTPTARHARQRQVPQHRRQPGRRACHRRHRLLAAVESPLRRDPQPRLGPHRQLRTQRVRDDLDSVRCVRSCRFSTCLANSRPLICGFSGLLTDLASDLLTDLANSSEHRGIAAERMSESIFSSPLLSVIPPRQW